MKATVIYQQKGQVCYNAYGESFILPELYELETPFYVCYTNGGESFKDIIAAFQEKNDLIEWMNAPLKKMVQKKRQLINNMV
jgi:hypothetical protein